MCNFNSSTINSFLRLKKQKVLTKKDYRKAFLRNPRFFLKNRCFIYYFRSYISSPSKTNTKNKMRFFLLIDYVIQFIRGVFKFLLADKPILVLMLGFLYIALREAYILHNFVVFIVLLTVFTLNLSVYLFYIIDHAISIVATIKSSLSASSEYLAKSYLDLTKVKSDVIDFLYFDKLIDYESRKMYEEWVLEILERLPIINDFNFNIYISEEDTNIFNESRKMVAIYDTPFKKVYEYSIASLGLYTSAGATIITKCISQEYFDNLMEIFKDSPINQDIKHYGKDILYFRKYNLYHELSHLITIDLYPILLDNDRYISIFNDEKHILFPCGYDYFISDIKEYTAECLARYLLEGRVGDYNMKIDFKETRTYYAIKHYINKLSKTKF